MARLRSSVKDLRVAVLYQSLPAPVINGVSKPLKPGGYQDSGADIAHALLRQSGGDDSSTKVITPLAQPDPARDQGWCFPDSEEGILAAIEKGANCLWANTVLFAEHPLQTSGEVLRRCPDLRVVGQPPRLVDAYDDKDFVNSWLRRTGRFDMPKSCTASPSEDLQPLLDAHNLQLPLVAKPIRGRGSQGVKVCRSLEELSVHLRDVLKTRSILEEFLSGAEGTVAVMPPSPDRSEDEYWAMPLVARFNHAEGIAPYSGAVAVTANSRVVTSARDEDATAVEDVARQCEQVARLLQVKAPIRIDVRKQSDRAGAKFAIFDVNMKPNMTIPGRPGRDDQSSLVMLAAAGLGWSPLALLNNIIATASPLAQLREVELSSTAEGS